MGDGKCKDSLGRFYSRVMVWQGDCDYAALSAESCADYCGSLPTEGGPMLRGFVLFTKVGTRDTCSCLYDAATGASFLGNACTGWKNFVGTATVATDPLLLSMTMLVMNSTHSTMMLG